MSRWWPERRSRTSKLLTTRWAARPRYGRLSVRCLQSLIALSIVTCALTLTGCASFGVRSTPRTTDRPAADLLAKPAQFAPPPVTVNPQTGEAELTGKDALPWALDTLSIGGEIRAKYVRLQNWVKALLEPRHK